jgi:hypothetical protein
MTRVAFDTREMRGAADLFEAASEYLQSGAASVGRVAGSPPSMPPSLAPHVVASLDALRSRTQTLATDLHIDAGTLVALAAAVEAAEAKGYEPILGMDMLKTTMKTVRALNRYSAAHGLPEEAAARVLMMGSRAPVADDLMARLPRAARVAWWIGNALNAVGYWQETNDFDETAWRTVITAGGTWAGGVAGGAFLTWACGFVMAPTGPGIATCTAVGVIGGGFGGGIAGDKLGEKLYEEETADDIMEMVERIERLPEPAREMVRVYIEDEGYSFVDALKTVELDYGHLDDPQIDE